VKAAAQAIERISALLESTDPETARVMSHAQVVVHRKRRGRTVRIAVPPGSAR